MSLFRLGAFSSFLILLQSPVLFAGVIYVDNLRGNDIFDGTTNNAINQYSGPVRTLQRGLQLMGHGDVLNIANTGRPYYESMELVGGRFSGEPLHPLIIEGNGAELNGSFPVPALAWRKAGKQLWRITPVRKGFYVLIRDDKPLPEVPVPANARQLPAIPEGQWAAWKGSIYFRTSPIEYPEDLNLWIAVRSVGVTLYDVHNVVVRNLKVRQFRIDGFNAHDRAKNVVLENITAEENGRAGVTAAGTSFLILEKPTIKNNRKYSVLITEKAGVKIDDESQVAPPPTIAE